MAAVSPPEVSERLQAWSRGDSSALKKLTPLVYKELHRLAHGYMGFENPGHTFQTTALVNGLPAPGLESGQLAESGALFRHFSPTDETDPGRLCPNPASMETRRRGAAGLAGGSHGKSPGAGCRLGSPG